jgi:hypothetical protein
MKLKPLRGTTSKLLRIFVQDSSKTDGSGLTGLAYNTSGLAWYYCYEGDTAARPVTLATATLGTWSTGGLILVDGANLPGVYEISVPNAALASGNSVVMMLRGTANMVPVLIEIELDAVNYQSAINMGLSALPTANPGAAGGVFIAGTNAATQVTTAFTSTFTGNLTGSVASVTGNVGGSVASVTGNVGGNVSGSVGSVTSAVTVAGTVSANVVQIAGQTASAAAGVTFPSAIMAAGNVTVGGYAVSQDPGTYVLVAAANKLATDGSGKVLLQATQTGVTIPTVTTVTNAVTAGTVSDKTGYSLNLTQTIPTSNTAQTVGDALNAARAQGFGKWFLSGTTLTIYAPDGTTPVRTFTLDSASAPTQRS